MRRCRGFTMVELLVAMTLALALIAGVMSAWATMQHSVTIAADRAALSERVLLGLDVIAAAADAGGVPAVNLIPEQARPARPNPCVLPTSPNHGREVLLLRAVPGAVPCFPSADMPADAPLLMVDTLIECAPGCPSPTSAGFLQLNPGCHPFLVRSSPEIRWVARQQRPADCAQGTRVALLERRLFYFREYAWRRGDGLGALMVRRLNPEVPLAWGRGEMLVAGVDDWQVVPRWSAACVRLGGCAASSWAEGVAVTLTLRGWARDTANADAISRLSLTRTLPGLTALVGDSP